MKDGRTTIRIDTDTLKRIRRMADTTGRSLNGMIDVLLRDSTGYIGNYPCLIKSGNEIIWVSPTGIYGSLNKMIYKRFLAGGLPITTGDRWDDAFDNMEDACNSFGTEICRQSSNGLVVSNLIDFIDINNKYF